MLYELFVANFFTPTQTLASNIRGLLVTSNLNLISTTRLNRIDLIVSNRLFLRDIASSTNPIKNLTITNNLLLNHSIFKGPYIAPVVQWLAFWQQTQLVPYERTTSNVSFTQEILVVKGKKPITSTLGLTQTISFRKVSNLTVTSNFYILQRQTGYLPNPSYVQGLNNYQITPQPKVILTDGVETFTIRRPDFGDTERFEASRLMRRTRAGTLLMFRKSYWPTSRTLNYTFSNLCADKGQRILAFLHKNLGKTISLTTHEGTIWNVICMTPAAELIQQLRSGQSITLEFQGEPIDQIIV